MNNYDKIKRNLFLSKDKQDTLSVGEREMSRRWAALFMLLMKNPLLSNRELIAFLCNGGIVTENGVLFEGDEFNGSTKLFAPVSDATAYRDIREVQSLVGEMRRVTKDYLRHVIYDVSMEMIQKGRENGDYDIVDKGMSHLIKAYKLDKDELEPTDWESMQQPSFEPSADVALLGISGLNTIKDYHEQRKMLQKKLNIAVSSS